MGRGLAAPLAALLATGLALGAPPTKAPPPTPSDLEALQRENVVLRQKLDLAKGREFYLILDTRQKTVALFLRGATLQTWRLAAIEVGGPRVVFVRRDLPTNWEGRIWTKGNLDPERRIDRFEMIAPPPSKEGTEVEIPIPPTPEEAYPVPARYHIRFEGGLSIEVIPPGVAEEAGFWARWRNRLTHWWHDTREALSPHPADTVRLRLTLSEKDASSLYRALPPDTKLFILPPSDARPAQ